MSLSAGWTYSIVDLAILPHQADADDVHDQGHHEQRDADREDGLVADAAGRLVPEPRRPDERRHGLHGFRGVERELSLIHISEPTRRTPISYAVFCLKK